MCDQLINIKVTLNQKVTCTIHGPYNRALRITQTHLDLEHVLGFFGQMIGLFVEDLAEGARDDAGCGVGLPVGRPRHLRLHREPLHRVGLARARLAVREHSAVVAAEHLNKENKQWEFWP